MIFDKKDCVPTPPYYDKGLEVFKCHSEALAEESQQSESPHGKNPLPIFQMLKQSFRIEKSPSPSARVKICGFTLAETLITLVIVGVVAAMTVPAMIAKYKEEETVTKVVRIYSTISQAFNMAKSNYANYPDSETKEEASENLANFIKPYLSISRDCGFEPGCFPDLHYKLFDGGDTVNFLSNPVRYMYNLNDGSAIAFLGYTTEDVEKYKTYGGVYYDTNGFKGPNKFGIDLFQFNIGINGIVNYNINHTNSGYDFVENCVTKGFECSAWIIKYKNLDYTHLNETELRNKYNIEKIEEPEEPEESGN